jgi:hypothetical protein
MRKRTTIYVLALLLVMACEYVLITWTQNYGADRDVVSHVGFAGTIVGMVLAVIAILYSYYQTFAQQRDAQTLSNQLHGLQQLVTTLRTQGDELVAVRRQIEETLSATGRTEQAITRLSAAVETMKAAAAAQTSAEPEAPIAAAQPEQAAESLAQLVVRRSAGYQFALYVAFCLASDSHLGERDMGNRIKKAVAARLTKQGQPNVADALGNWIDGISAGYLDLLADLRIIHKHRNDDLTFTVGDEFRHAVQQRLEREPKDDPEVLIDVATAEQTFSTGNAA